MATLTTKDIRDLVVDVLERGVQRTEHVIDEVFLAIEAHRLLRAEYEGLCGKHGADLTNQMIGRWTSSILGWPARTGGAQVPARNTLSKTYSVLVPTDRKLTAHERRELAGNEVLAFFKRYRLAFDRDALVPHRDALEQRVLDGEPVEEAFLSLMAEKGLDAARLQAAIAADRGG